MKAEANWDGNDSRTGKRTDGVMVAVSASSPGFRK